MSQAARKAAEPVVLHSWIAKRSGAFITIHALDAHGQPFNVTGVESIDGPCVQTTDPEFALSGRPVATDCAGGKYILA